jgi:gas vesicle protein
MELSSIPGLLSDLIPLTRRRTSTWLVPAALGAGLGLAAGIGVGMLVAPQSGAATRLRLRAGARQMKERALSAAERARIGIGDAMGDMSERAGSYGEEMRSGM